jgi:hypothetical protein
LTRHFIITRYNLAVPQWYEENENLFESQKWLEKRNDHFLRFCYPSVINQTSNQFTWLIFFQSGTEHFLKPVLLKLGAHSFIQPIFINGVNELEAYIYENIYKSICEETRKIIMTRLDNDDAIGSKFTYVIQKQARFLEGETILDFKNGLCLDLVSARLTQITFELNQFISLIVDVDKFQFGRSIYSFEHLTASKKYPIKQIDSKNLWLQIVHDENQLNYFWGKFVSLSNLKGYPDYGIQNSFDKELKVMKSDFRRCMQKIPGYYRLKKLFN